MPGATARQVVHPGESREEEALPGQVDRQPPVCEAARSEYPAVFGPGLVRLTVDEDARPVAICHRRLQDDIAVGVHLALDVIVKGPQALIWHRQDRRCRHHRGEADQSSPRQENDQQRHDRPLRHDADIVGPTGPVFNPPVRATGLEQHERVAHPVLEVSGRLQRAGAVSASAMRSWRRPRRRSGVVVLAGTAFYPGGSPGAAGADRIRISLPVSSRDAIQAGARRLQEVLPELQRGSR